MMPNRTDVPSVNISVRSPGPWLMTPLMVLPMVSPRLSGRLGLWIAHGAPDEQSEQVTTGSPTLHAKRVEYAGHTKHYGHDDNTSQNAGANLGE